MPKFSYGVDATYGNYMIIRPDAPISTRNTGVIWSTGAGRTLANVQADGVSGSSLKSELRLIVGLGQTYTVIVSDLKDTVTNAANSGFGNSSEQSAMEAMRQVLIAAGCDSDVIVGGISQGHTIAVAFAAAFPARVRGVFAGIPGCNLTNIRIDNFLGARAAVDLAAGVTYPAALPAGFETADKAATLATNSTPWRAWAGDADPAVRIADARTFATAYGNLSALTEVSGGGHSDTTLDAIDLYDLRSWIASL